MMVRPLGLKKAITEYFRQETQNSARRLTSHEWTVTNEVSSLLDDVSEATIRMQGATDTHLSQAMFMREVIEMLDEDKQPIRLPDATVLPVPDGTDVLDVLTSLSDCRQEPVEKMERRILGVSYMSYWMDFYNDIFCCEFLCVRLISVSFSVSLFRLPRRGLPRPTGLFSGYHAEGYHARTDAFKLTGYHVCRVTTPELPHSI